MSTSYYDEFHFNKINAENSVFEQLSLSEKQKLLQGRKTSDVLLLRDKTKSMCDKLYWYLKRDDDFGSYRILDIGVGAGWIPIELHEWDMLMGRQRIDEYHGIDIDDKALAYAEKNAQANNIDLHLYKGNLLEPISGIISDNPKKNIVVTANLPYNTDKDWETYDEVVKSEPRNAIVGGGEDGLDVFREFLLQFKKYHSHIHMIIMQSSYKNVDQLWEMCNALHIPGMAFHIEDDNFGKRRFVMGVRRQLRYYESPHIGSIKGSKIS